MIRIEGRQYWIGVAVLTAVLTVLTAGCDGGVAPTDAGTPPGDARPSMDATMGDASTCERGAEGCGCRSNGTCDAELRCDEGTERCVPCPAGSEGCACADRACDTDDLMCSGDVCVAVTCTDGTVGCPCRSDDPACDGNAYCTPGGTCAVCAADVPGCPCAAGACGGGLVCDAASDSCRAPRTCADLLAAGLCVENQLCNESADGTDAECVAAACVEELRWSTELGACVACASRGCSAEPTCEAGAAGSIADECAGEQRACDTDVDGIGSCGDCLAGFSDIDGTCRPQIDCGGTTCALDEYCDSSAEEGPACAPRPCADSMAADASGACTVACISSCAIEGSTGRHWPFADREGNCLCETLPGYFLDNGGEIRPVLCDADRDGWVRDEVRNPNLSGPSADPALAANLRCDIETIDHVVLRDEYGLSSTIDSCAEGLLQDRGIAPCSPMPLRLLESRRNDIPGEAERLGEAPPYGAGGRRLRADELNGLTKACTGLLGDYDDDGTEDVDQAQPTPADTSALGEVQRLRSFAHFIELYSMSYVAPSSGGTAGHLLIQERSRCSDFPLGYGADTAFDVNEGSTYWRNCERRRDPLFDADSPAPNFDFAQWSCSARNGSCPAPAEPANAAYATPPDPDDALIRGHGLCNLAGAPPTDGQWRGMNHHTQFQCVQLVADDPAPLPRSRDRALGSFASGELTYDACQVVDCAGVAGCTDSTALSGGGSDPEMTCAPVAADSLTEGLVGWAAVGYRPYGHEIGTDPAGTPAGGQEYLGGCVNEDAEWGFLCPSPEYTRCDVAPTSAFGRYRCFGWDSLFLWADDAETPADYRRSSLVYAMESAPALNMSVWNVEPAPFCE